MQRIKIDYSSSRSRPRRLGARVAALSGLIILATTLGYTLIRTPASTPTEELNSAAPAQAPPTDSEQTAASTGELPVIGRQIDTSAPPVTGALGDSIEIIIKRNDTLDRIFRRLNLSIRDLAQLRTLPDVRQALDFLKPGDKLTVTHQDGELRGLIRKLNDTQTLSVTRNEAGFAAEILENPLERLVQRKQGRIDSSLFAAASSAGVSDQTIMSLAYIFGWDIDFVLDIRSGDEFTVVYEQLWQDGEFIRDGSILAAQFVNNGNVYRAVRYEFDDGGADYFTPEGKSMRKAFLRAPLEFTRISSNFNPRRRHPILNTIRAHKGVDYAAPSGTPVKAAGDGRVISRGWQGGYGNAVVLEHGGGITTLYGHLKGFAKGLRVGQRVRQGQVIGYVGMTGLASGPHLHYEYRLNGVHRNPRTVKLPDAKPIAPELLADFKLRTAPLLAKLEHHDSDSLLALR